MCALRLLGRRIPVTYIYSIRALVKSAACGARWRGSGRPHAVRPWLMFLDGVARSPSPGPRVSSAHTAAWLWIAKLIYKLVHLEEASRARPPQFSRTSQSGVHVIYGNGVDKTPHRVFANNFNVSLPSYCGPYIVSSLLQVIISSARKT